jgi:hypothetical protein
VLWVWLIDKRVGNVKNDGFEPLELHPLDVSGELL